MTEIQGKLIFIQVSARFELARVELSGVNCISFLHSRNRVRLLNYGTTQAEGSFRILHAVNSLNV